MAKIDPNKQLTGSVGPVYYRSFNGKTYVQTKPGKGNVKQAEVVKQNASDFGRASRMAKFIRQALLPILQNHSDNTFYQRFAARVHHATQDGNPQPKGSRSLLEGNLLLLSAIECNVASPFAEYCTVLPQPSLSVNRELTIALPEMDIAESIAQYKNATDAELAFLVSCVHPETGQQTHAELFKLGIPLSGTTLPPQEWTSAPLPENQLIVIASAVFYFRSNSIAGLIGYNGKEFHPCSVTGVMRSSETD